MASGSPYDPARRGRHPVGVATIRMSDTARGRAFPCEIWYPAAARHAGHDLEPATQDRFTVTDGQPPRAQAAVRDAVAAAGRYPLVLYSHHGHGHRRAASYLCTHLASHGYVVAALDHSEVVSPEWAQLSRAERIEAWIGNRVPDVCFLLDRMLDGDGWRSGAGVDFEAIGLAGHSFGGWSVLATPDVERRVQAIVALAPGGSSRPMPGIIPAGLAFGWDRPVPTLYLAADRDVSTPLGGIFELFDRTPAARHLVVLSRADHLHFVDDVEHEHEAARAMTFPGEAAWIPAAMPPMAELCSGEQAHTFVRALALCHLDATLRGLEPARRLLEADVRTFLAAHGVDVRMHAGEPWRSDMA